MDHLIIWIMFSHWIADFLCQTTWMSMNKSKNILALFSHGLVYTGMLIYLVFMVGGRMIGTLGLEDVLYFGVANGILHFCVDGVSSTITSYLWKKEKIHNFFCVIGLDQFVHFVTLYVTMKMYLLPECP
jgi:hypothetical protein